MNNSQPDSLVEVIGMRNGALVGLLVAACTFGTTEASDVGQSGEGDGDSTSAMSTSGGASTTSVDDAGQEGEAGSAADATGDGGPVSTTTGEDSDASDSDGSGSSSGGEAGGLVSRGLLVRYFLDEAASGQEETIVHDSADNPLDLPLSYSLVPSQPEFIEVAGNSGLQWTEESEAGAAMVDVGGTKIIDALDGATIGTIEVVIDVDALARGTLSSRFIAIGDDAQAGDFALSANTNSGFWFRLNDLTPFMYAHPIEGGGRKVVHAVMDTSAAMATDRVRLYVDGDLLAPTNGSGPGQGEAISLETQDELIVGNTSAQVSSAAGRVFYAAMYTVALTPDEVADNVAILAVDDDGP